MSCFLIKQDQRSRRRTQRFDTFEAARTAADRVLARPEMFRAVWITDASTGAELFHALTKCGNCDQPITREGLEWRHLPLTPSGYRPKYCTIRPGQLLSGNPTATPDASALRPATETEKS